MKKILFISYDLAGKGGIEVVSKKLSQLLTAHGYYNEFFFIHDRNNNTITDDLWLDGIQYTRINSNIKNTKLRRLHFAFQLSKFLRKKTFDVLITLSPLDCFIANLARKILFSNHSIYSWVHGSLQYQYKKEYLKKADRHLAISSGIANGLKKLGIKEDKIDIIYNPISRQNEVIKRTLEKVNFIYIGRLDNEQKNIFELIYALSSLENDWHIDIIGDGPDKIEIQKLASINNILEKMTFHGWKKNPWNYVIENIHEVTALLLTSKYEGFGMVLAEACSYGVLCITSDCDSGPRDIIFEGINGYLYCPGNPIDLSNKLQILFENKKLPSQLEIKNSIHDFYDDNYINNIIKIIS